MLSSRSLLGVAALIAAFTAGCGEANRGVALYGGCVSCHGPTGNGNAEVGAPAIAGLPQWYIEAQLKKFRGGVRGYHGDDITGLRMRPMALTLPEDADVTEVAAYVSSLPVVPQHSSLEGGNVENGKSRYVLCATCHGPDGKGIEKQNAPPIGQLPDWYLLAQLQKFKGGIRGNHPEDKTGAVMRANAMTLPDEQTMKDVIAYIQTLPD